MSLPAWPAGVPIPMYVETWQAARPEGHIARTQFEDGDARRRRRTRETWHLVPVKLLLTTAQHATWRTFYYSTLNHGVSRFTVSIQRPGSTASNRIASIETDPVDDVSEPPFVTVTFTLLVLNYYD